MRAFRDFIGRLRRPMPARSCRKALFFGQHFEECRKNRDLNLEVTIRTLEKLQKSHKITLEKLQNLFIFALEKLQLLCLTER
jgi:hypothetical protein